MDILQDSVYKVLCAFFVDIEVDLEVKNKINSIISSLKLQGFF